MGKDRETQLGAHEQLMTPHTQQLMQQLSVFLTNAEKRSIPRPPESRLQDIQAAFERNTYIAELHAEYDREVKPAEDALLPQGITIGIVECIDGRLPDVIHGFKFQVKGTPGGEITTCKRKSDGESIPASSVFTQSLSGQAAEGKELLEIVCAHTSLKTNHKCGAVGLKQASGRLDAKGVHEDEGLRLVKETSIPAITRFYNDVRETPLATVAIPALIDTDTQGMILNYDKRDEAGSMLSSTDLTLEFRATLDAALPELHGFASMADTFNDPKELIELQKRIIAVTTYLMNDKNVMDKLDTYINSQFNDLTDKQRQALKFTIARRVGFQYVSGLAQVNNDPHHAYAHHEEAYLSVSHRGKAFGDNDTVQAFISSPSGYEVALNNIKLKLKIVGEKPMVLYVSHPISARDIEVGGHNVRSAKAELLDQFNEVIEDEELRVLIDNGSLTVVPVLIDSTTSKPLQIVDLSAHI